MAKQSGLGDNFYVGGYDLSGDINSVEGGSPLETLDMTGIDKSAYERIGGLRDGKLDLVAFFNPAAGRAHPVLDVLPDTDSVCTYARGTALGSPAACMVAKRVSYDGTRGDDGKFTFKVGAVANGYGLEWGRQLTAGKRADTTGTNGGSVDFGGSTAFGLQAYLQVFAFTGTSCTVKLQESSDDGAGDAWADVTGGSFGAQTAIGASRIQTARGLTVERYLRVVTSGTFSACTFSVVVVKNEAQVSF